MTTDVPTPSAIDRRTLLAGLAGTLLTPAGAGAQPATGGRATALQLRARPATRVLKPGSLPSEFWALEPADGQGMPTLRRGDTLAVSFRNELPVPAALNWHGLDGQPAAEPLLARAPVAPGATDQVAVTLPHAGTLLCEARLLGDGQTRAAGALALNVGTDDGLAADLDETWLIEDARLRSDGGTAAPGVAAPEAAPLYTLNGEPSRAITLRPRQRLRIRFINGCQRAAISLKIENHDVRVMAIDGQPAEPFAAREGQLILAPGTRIDALIDAGAAGATSRVLLFDGAAVQPIGEFATSGDPARTAPLPPPPALPSNGLPDRIDLKAALRADLVLDRAAGPAGGWVPPLTFNASAAPAFRVRRNRAVVIALANRAATAVTFHLHGHHMRLLDRLDDGWKPFWLDTLVVGPGQTQRVAFKAETAGPWLMESMATDWSAPRLIRHYVVE